MSESGRTYEEFKVSGDHLLSKIKELIDEGSVRRVYLKNDEGETFLKIPLPAGVAVIILTLALAPALIAVGAIAALLTEVTIGVERDRPGRG